MRRSRSGSAFGTGPKPPVLGASIRAAAVCTHRGMASYYHEPGECHRRHATPEAEGIGEEQGRRTEMEESDRVSRPPLAHRNPISIVMCVIGCSTALFLRASGRSGRGDCIPAAAMSSHGHADVARVRRQCRRIDRSRRLIRRPSTRVPGVASPDRHDCAT
jgi:hypothetical protein